MQLLKKSLGKPLGIAAWAVLALLGTSHSWQLQAAEIYVSATGDNTDGLSWSTGYHHIQDAVYSANEGDVIWIDEGFYPQPGDGSHGSIMVDKSLSFYARYNHNISPVRDMPARGPTTVVPTGFELMDGPGDNAFVIQGFDFTADAANRAIVHGHLSSSKGITLANNYFSGSNHTTLYVLINTSQDPHGANYRMDGLLMHDNIFSQDTTNASVSIKYFDKIFMSHNVIERFNPGVGNPLIYITDSHDVIQIENSFIGSGQTFMGTYFRHCTGVVYSAFNSFNSLQSAYQFGEFTEAGGFFFAIEKNQIDNCLEGFFFPGFMHLNDTGDPSSSQYFSIEGNNITNTPMFLNQPGVLEDYTSIDIGSNYFPMSIANGNTTGISLAEPVPVDQESLGEFLNANFNSLTSDGDTYGVYMQIRNAELGIAPPDFITPWWSYETPLHRVTSYPVAVALVAGGADVNARDNHGRTPLHVAKDTRIMRLLLNHGADVNAYDHQGETPLFSASSSKAVRVLIGAGAHIHHMNRLDQTALHRAVNVHVTKQLLQFGANAYAMDSFERTALHYAKDPRMAEALLHAGLDVNERDYMSRTPLHYQVDEAHVVLALIDNGADVNAQDDKGFSPLHFVNDPLSARELLEHHAMVDMMSIEGLTPLHTARNAHVVEEFLHAGADPEARDFLGQTPLHHAANGGVAEALVGAGADVNAADCEGFKPLHYARDEHVVDVLILAGADPDGA